VCGVLARDIIGVPARDLASGWPWMTDLGRKEGKGKGSVKGRKGMEGKGI
jgi:hypothetical protein